MVSDGERKREEKKGLLKKEAGCVGRGLTHHLMFFFAEGTKMFCKAGRVRQMGFKLLCCLDCKSGGDE